MANAEHRLWFGWRWGTYAAVSAMRQRRSHLALVESQDQPLGLLTRQDLLDRLLPADHHTAT